MKDIQVHIKCLGSFAFAIEEDVSAGFFILILFLLNTRTF